MQVFISKVNIEKTIDLLQVKFQSISPNGCFFAFVTNEYDLDGNVLHDFFDIIKAATDIGYQYVNTIVFPNKNINSYLINDNVRYVVWLCKDQKRMTFNKDFIREKHIWKDVEWGKREKNYNPKGKDPGNVWIPTRDDGHANITEHIILSELEVIDKILAMTCCGKDYEIVESDEMQVCPRSFNLSCAEVLTEQHQPVVVFGTSEKMSNIESDSVSLIVTSPPYWDLKDYFKKGQIGQESYEKYLDRMGRVWEQCFDKLSNTGSMWVNINIRVSKGQVILIPYEFIKTCRKIGFYYKGVIIWHKSSGIPTHEKNIVDRHEYILIFSKSNEWSLKKDILESFADYKNEELNGKAFWNINRKAGSVGQRFVHPAIYPKKLVERIVLCSTNKNELVVDPFLGSGTSLIAASNTYRNFIGYEFNDGFKELMETRFSKELTTNNNIIYKNDN